MESRACDRFEGNIQRWISTSSNKQIRLFSSSRQVGGVVWVFPFFFCFFAFLLKIPQCSMSGLGERLKKQEYTVNLNMADMNVSPGNIYSKIYQPIKQACDISNINLEKKKSRNEKEKRNERRLRVSLTAFMFINQVTPSMQCLMKCVIIRYACIPNPLHYY